MSFVIIASVVIIIALIVAAVKTKDTSTKEKEAASPKASQPEQEPEYKDVFIAKTPILNNSQKIVGYGISAGGKTVDSKSLKQVVGLFSSGFDVDKILYMPINEEVLHDDALTLLPQGTVFIMPIDALSTNNDVRREYMIKEGYHFAVIQDDKHQPPSFVNFAFTHLKSGQDTVKAAINLVRGNSLRIIVMGVESEDDFTFSKTLGVSRYQGYFFAESEYIEPADIGAKTSRTMKIINLVMAKEEPEVIEDAFKLDPDLTFRLLKYINSAAVGLRQEVDSIKPALLMMGYEKLARWLSVLLVSSDDIDSEAREALFELSAQRGREMELFGKALKFTEKEQDALFMAGMFSLLEQVLQTPLTQALDGLILNPDVEALLTNNTGKFKPVFDLAIASEKGDLNSLEKSGLLTMKTISAIHDEAGTWTQLMIKDS